MESRSVTSERLLQKLAAYVSIVIYYKTSSLNLFKRQPIYITKVP
jgi:hypothetical protein